MKTASVRFEKDGNQVLIATDAIGAVQATSETVKGQQGAVSYRRGLVVTSKSGAVLYKWESTYVQGDVDGAGSAQDFQKTSLEKIANALQGL